MFMFMALAQVCAYFADFDFVLIITSDPFKIFKIMYDKVC